MGPIAVEANTKANLVVDGGQFIIDFTIDNAETAQY